MTKTFAIALPVLPGKTEQLKKFTNELRTTFYNEFKASRIRLGVRERTFLQSTPSGDTVIVTLEGTDPQTAFAEIGKGTDVFTIWFVKQTKEIHGIDLSKKFTGTFPELLIQTEPVKELA